VDHGVVAEHDGGAPAARDLEEDDAEAVDVGLGAGPASHPALRVHVPQRAGEHRGVGAPGVVDEPGEPKSPSLAVKEASSITLLGLMSLCMTHCSHSWCR